MYSRHSREDSVYLSIDTQKIADELKSLRGESPKPKYFDKISSTSSKSFSNRVIKAASVSDMDNYIITVNDVVIPNVISAVALQEPDVDAFNIQSKVFKVKKSPRVVVITYIGDDGVTRVLNVDTERLNLKVEMKNVQEND